MEQLKQVKEWHEKFGVPVLDKPTIPSVGRCWLRERLLQEELNEFSEACREEDIIEVADALGDLLYLVLGTVLEFGLQDKFVAIFDEIQRSNLSKLDENGNVVMRGDGKILKSKLFTPPNIKAIIEDGSAI